jgi:hypothetical protein
LHDGGSERLGWVRSVVRIGEYFCMLEAIRELRRHRFLAKSRHVTIPLPLPGGDPLRPPAPN